jgi:dihydroxy-acid dehydratase
VNLQPAGEYFVEDFYRAGGVPAVIGELLRAGLLAGDALTVNGKTLDENCADARILDEDVIRPGAVLEMPVKYQRLAQTVDNLRDSH